MSDPIRPESLPPQLTEFCAEVMGGPATEALFHAVAGLTPSDSATILAITGELIASSRKSAAIGLRDLPKILDRFGAAQAIPWMDLGTTLATQSSTAAQKYFTESPDLLSRVEVSRRQKLLALGLELAETHYGVVLDFIRACPRLPSAITPASLSTWMELGLQLAEEDAVLAVEYFRISPDVLSLLSVADLPLWVQWGRRLVVPNTLGKPDYIKVIEYFRLSAEILAALEPPDIRRTFIDLGETLARTSATTAMDFLRTGSSILQGISSPVHRRLFISQAHRIAERAPSLVMDFLSEGSKMFLEPENNPTDFITWVDVGLSLLGQNPGRAQAYFTGRSKTGLDAGERIRGGVSLLTVGRVLSLYVQGLSGQPVSIRPTTDLPEGHREVTGGMATTDGRTIYLPPRVRLFSGNEDNFLVYKLSTLHEAAHLEFGTYRPRLGEIQDVVERLRQAYARDISTPGPVRTIEMFLGHFPDPAWARFLWTILEDTRVDFRIRLEYPGAARDMDRMIGLDLASRPKLENLPPRLAIREALLQLSVSDSTEVPLELAETVSGAYRLLCRMKSSQVSSTDSLRILPDLYGFIQEELGRFPTVKGESDPLGAQEEKILADSPGPRGKGGVTVQSTTLSYRGAMHPEWARDFTPDETVPLPPGDEAALPAGPLPDRERIAQVTHRNSNPDRIPDRISRSRSGSTEEKVYFYDEWDTAAGEFRPQWCRLRERWMEPRSGQIVQETRTAYGPIIRLLRRHFQALKPEGFKKTKREPIGEDLDLDAVVEARTEIRSRRMPHDRVYIKSEKRRRDVAAAFLIDLSGSTSRHIPSAGKRVIEIEQQALVLLTEAIQAIGDDFAIYGFSGESRENVDFFIIKEFGEPLSATVHERIGAARPLNQNRDGAAIRHASAKLREQPSKTRLLVLLSDGKPLDRDYAGAYSLEDTKKALREARISGIHPYCITIDREASRYVTEMYGEIRYTIIDRVDSLPQKLPRIYRRLTT